MVDRQDIDALLVGALYGELTPADEARLATHLESHPADRGVLDDLKHARAAVKASRIFEVQAEPPQAVSALLLQEAHRRAPKAADAKEGWFARLARSFMVHPAMAAAAMLVLVVGVAGTLYLRKGGDEFASKESGAPAITAAQTPSAAPSGGTPLDEAKRDVGQGSSFAVGMAEPADTETAGAAREQGAQGGDDKYARADRRALDPIAAGPGAATGAMPKPEPKGKKEAIAVETHVAKPSPPKDLDDTFGASGNKVAVSKVAPKHAAEKSDETVALDSKPMKPTMKPSTTSTTLGLASDTPAGGGAAVARAENAPTTTTLPAPQAAPAPPRGYTGNSNGKAAGAPAPTTPPQAAPQAPAPPPPPAVQQPREPSKTANAAPAPKQPAPQQAQQQDLIAWAKAELQKAISLARADKCNDSVTAQMNIRNRAPDFWAQNVADNRELKGCAAYANTALEAENERAAKKAAKARAKAAADEAPAASPPPAKASDTSGNASKK